MERLAAPTQRRSHGVWQITNCERLGMSTIAPIGVQVTNRAILQTGFGSSFEIRETIVVPPNQRHPGRRSRAHVKWDAGLREQPGFFFEWMIGFVTPVQRDKI